MILNLHGFLSSGENSKKKMLIELFPGEQVLSPDLPISPFDAMDLCSKLLAESERKDSGFIVGSSLGGFYAYCLSQKHDIPCLLLNPSLTPFIHLEKKLGDVTNHKTGELHQWTLSHIRQLRDLFATSYMEHQKKLLNLIIALDDKDIDHESVTSVLETHSNSYIERETGGHRFDDLRPLYELIKSIREDYLAKKT